ncbi:hypothetical protein [Lactiplantibacillus plantarum]|uniref:hypothetical protein n=1 Tax=Lactiplantibacillus plantarum TaxID=1590 RepID=UPI00062DC4DD|nr:hypothetical protein [Lactiplantibacillus plantarum]EKP1542728.1 hypothetical protein [Campylobacter jejuni]DAM85578.1 MAG TPA: Protein of unknown function (DUF2977) [Caudoviricetes sp.]KLD40430.1 hypothetical protein WU67_15330 [Lactiplantibacillus plantarum]KLD61086.1 hypothetical protein WP50_05150 [Lactiplantibacillus plantarum]KZU34075.1 hypothetical protein Nizo2741_2667 [Lactiplantibacillus plantarum]
MKLTLNEDNHIIGVNQDDSTYDYDGYVPDDLTTHAADGFYMVMYNTIMPTPVISDGTAMTTPSPVMQAINALGLKVAALEQKIGDGKDA